MSTARCAGFLFVRRACTVSAPGGTPVHRWTRHDTRIVDPERPRALRRCRPTRCRRARGSGYFTTTDKVRLRYAHLAQERGGAARARSASCRGAPSSSRNISRRSPISSRAALPSRPSTGAGRAGRTRLIGNPQLGYVDSFEDYWSDLKSFHARDPAARLPAAVLPRRPFDGRAGVAAMPAIARPHDVRPHLPVGADGGARPPAAQHGAAWRGSPRRCAISASGRLPVGRRQDKPPTRGELSRQSADLAT